MLTDDQIKQLRQYLASKGLECKGCSEKPDFVQMAFDAQDLPEVPKIEEKKEEPRPAATSDEDLEEIMAKLRSSSFGSPNVFRPGDFDGLTAEQISEKVRACLHGC